ncbi:hypothetical protein GC173_12500 [bacterium]|nr:hypothetical protein [bacterium]
MESRIVRQTGWLILPALLVVLAVLLIPARASAQAFPFYDRQTSFQDASTTETWRLYPFHSVVETTSTMTIALHPIFSWHRNRATGGRDFDILWPIFTDTYRAERGKAKDYKSTYLFPLFFQRKETRFGQQNRDQMILPIWFKGKQGERGRYTILFPFIWYAYNARLAAPLFPPREQTFAAIFPLIGDFRGYHNRDRIFFFLWPLYVKSSEGTGENYNEVQSILWPFLGKYGGHKTSGFRLWPLVAYTSKEGEYKRAFWIWPLGQYRSGRISKTNPEKQQVTMFIPFFARFRQPNVSLDFVFPFYGDLRVGDRRSTGYFLAMYNRDVNYRQGTREDRYFLFLIRKKSRLKGFDGKPIVRDKDVPLGGGFFPFYTRTYTDRRVRKNIIWPISIYKWNKYDEYEYERKYLLPFYVDQERRFNNGDTTYIRFIFPFFRQRRSLSDVERRNVLHFFWYSDVDKIDRLYAPLWTWSERTENLRTGAVTTRLFKNLSVYEKRPDRSTQRQFKGFIADFEETAAPNGVRKGRTRLLFGLLKTERDGEARRLSSCGVTLLRW